MAHSHAFQLLAFSSSVIDEAWRIPIFSGLVRGDLSAVIGKLIRAEASNSHVHWKIALLAGVEERGIHELRAQDSQALRVRRALRRADRGHFFTDKCESAIVYSLVLLFCEPFDQQTHVLVGVVAVLNDTDRNHILERLVGDALLLIAWRKLQQVQRVEKELATEPEHGILAS